MSPSSEPQVGEAWAYRARADDPLVQVVVQRIGVRAPRRIRIRFVDDVFEGLEDWVPPARLKVPWLDVGDFMAREARWNAVIAGSEGLSEVDERAASVVFDQLIDPAHATLGYNATRGVTTIANPMGLADRLGFDRRDLAADPSCFEEGGSLVVAWPVTESIARQAVQREPDAIMRYVQREEADARREAVFGRHYPRRGPSGPEHIPAEICVEIDEEYGRQVRAVLRSWCGAEAVSRWSELADLRAEVLRLSNLVQSATTALRHLGADREADRVEGELSGMPAPPAKRRHASRSATL